MPTRKPRPGKEPFPLWRHKGTGQWCKKIQGRFHYFGLDSDEAAKAYYRLLDGRETGREVKSGTTVGRLCNELLARKLAIVKSGELTVGHWDAYKAVCDEMIDTFKPGRPVPDLAPIDFAKLRDRFATRLGPHALKKFITLARAVFSFGFDEGLIAVPVRYSSAFDRPKKSTLALARRAKGKKLIPESDLLRMMDAADVQFRAMLYLGINCAYGNSDCTRLTRTMLGAEPGWIDSPRVKTGAERRCPLWPETVAALDAVLDVRPDAKRDADDDLVFLTAQGHPWTRSVPREGKPALRADNVVKWFVKLSNRLGLKLAGRFYTLRHTFRTVADEVRDTPAIRLIMGHTDSNIDDTYRERIGDDRLLAVAEHVREWLNAGRTAQG